MGTGEAYPDRESPMNHLEMEATWWVKRIRIHENGNEIFMNGSIVPTIFHNTVMKLCFRFFFS